MNFRKYLNFLFFLTSELPVSIIQNSILLHLYRKIEQSEITRLLNSAVTKNRHPNLCSHFNLYIHVPFCKEYCYYCHCSKCLLTEDAEMVRYQNSLIKQMEFYSLIFKDVNMASLYFGGGTPSLLSANVLNNIFENLFKNFSFKKNFQINFEAHPSSLTLEKIKILKHYGVNRISLGVQALDKNVLKAVNRIQDEKMVFRVIENIKKLNFSYINIDLIAGLPKQTTETFILDLKKIISYRPDVIHINPLSDITSSIYYKNHKGLEIKEIFRKRIVMIKAAKEILDFYGYNLMDLEAFSFKRKAKNYQQFYSLNYSTSILGLGPFSSSMLFGTVTYKTLPSNDDLSKLSFFGYPITERYNMAQFVILNLLNGFTNEKFKKVFKKDICKVFKEELDFLKQSSIIKADNHILKYSGDWNTESLFEYFAYAKIFYGQDILSKLKQKYRKTYNPKHSYTFQKDGFLKKMEDPFFLLTQFKVGF